MPDTARRTLIIAGLLLSTATALGAFGFHTLRTLLPPDRYLSYDLAVTYQFFHALGLLGIGLLQRQLDSGALRWAGRLILFGLALFAGSIYAMTAGAPKILGAVAPLGGLSLMIAWVLFAMGVGRSAAAR
ncbi:MAG: DUF423 domain-containing protein [Steroidobacteraceae bacterium]